MRCEKGHKESTRRRIIETAATEFRRNGIDGISVADLMAKTWLTHGVFRIRSMKSSNNYTNAAVRAIGPRSYVVITQKVDSESNPDPSLLNLSILSSPGSYKDHYRL
jgi:hypothetical protein